MTKSKPYFDISRWTGPGAANPHKWGLTD